MILDEMVVISLEALEESHDSNVRFCLAGPGVCPGRKANIQLWKFILTSLPVRSKTSQSLPENLMADDYTGSRPRSRKACWQETQVFLKR